MASSRLSPTAYAKPQVRAERQFLTPGDADFEQMHHALGRPDGAWVTPYRNYYCCAAKGPDAERFAVLGSYWNFQGLINKGDDAIYAVTPHGVREVMAWLAIRRRASGLRPWRVYGGGISPRVVVAKSASAAKYNVWLGISDVWPVTFGEFVRQGVSARAA